MKKIITTTIATLALLTAGSTLISNTASAASITREQDHYSWYVNEHGYHDQHIVFLDKTHDRQTVYLNQYTYGSNTFSTVNPSKNVFYGNWKSGTKLTASRYFEPATGLSYWLVDTPNIIGPVWIPDTSVSLSPTF